MKTTMIKCIWCGSTQEYNTNDLIWDGDQANPDFYIVCKACKEMTGTTNQLQPLIDDLPDYVPDEDMEYERMNNI